MRRVLLLAAVAWLGGCKTAEQAARIAARATPEGRAALREYDRYRRIAHILKKYHDSQTLDGNEVLGVLRDVGVIRGPAIPPVPGAPRPKTPPSGPAPFPVPEYKGQYGWPLKAGIVSSEFGPRWGRMHEGIDIAADRGVPVLASADGEVIYSAGTMRGYGIAVIVRHDQETTTLYAHNQENRVRVGDKVKSGQLIAILGTTGHSSGPHCHFEIRVGGKPLNPRTRLVKGRF